MTTAEQLSQVFCNNFVAYYRSHVAHVNIMGRNFYSDHKLLQKVYEDLQEQIDRLGELLRSINEYMPCEIQDVLNRSEISTAQLDGDSDYLLSEVRDDLDNLKAAYILLEETAELEEMEEIANYAQDRILALAKFIWMLDSTLS
jgi:DNA-binding ferritin-like protein